MAKRAKAAAKKAKKKAQPDGYYIPKLIMIGSTPASIKKVQAKAAKAMADIGYKYPTKSCAATLSAFLQEAGIGVPMTYGAGKLASRLRNDRDWDRIDLGDQQPGDVGVTYDNDTSIPGADHIYLVIEAVDEDLMMIVDNQAQGKTHTRYVSGKGGKTPTEYFLRAPGVESTVLRDEDTDDLPERYDDDGSPIRPQKRQARKPRKSR